MSWDHVEWRRQMARQALRDAADSVACKVNNAVAQGSSPKLSLGGVAALAALAVMGGAQLLEDGSAAPAPGLMPAELSEPEHQAEMPAPLAPEPMPAEPEVPVLESRALIHGCAYCGALPGERCKTSSGRLVPRDGAHGARWQAAGGRQA